MQGGREARTKTTKQKKKRKGKGKVLQERTNTKSFLFCFVLTQCKTVRSVDCRTQEQEIFPVFVSGT